MYSWQFKNFPDFTFDQSKIQPHIEDFTLALGETNGLLLGFSEKTKQEIFIEIMLVEALKTSEIEGEYFSREEVMSSLKLNLGIKDFHQNTKNNKANAIAQLMIDVQNTYSDPLNEPLLLHWHELLMNTEKGINAGKYRSGIEPMQVISGSFGNFTVHYEAPPSKDLPNLMKAFFNWYQNFSKIEVGKIGEAMLFSALTHLYFETLHPFKDGNGRIGRALAEKALAEKLELPIFISLSKAIEKNKAQYYTELKKAQRDLQISDWISYFFNILSESIKDTKSVVLFTLKKTMFFEKFKNNLNERQHKVINKMMEQGGKGFQGGMTAKKYMSINRTSKATATRDLQQLAEIKAFIKIGGGRSVNYQLYLE